MSIYSSLRRPPFNLDDRAIAWVKATFDRLSLDEKVAQLFVLALTGGDATAFDQVKRLKPGGIVRHFTPDFDFERAMLGDIIEACPVPPIIAADLEAESPAFGTPMLGQLGLAAVNDVEATEQAGRIMAEEARAMGVTWSFTPAIDINAAFRNAAVAARSYGSDIGLIKRHALAHIRGVQQSGVAATVRHWPGDGYDDRDRHLVTTVNPLSLDEWMASFGRLYRRMFAEGVLSVMTGHIAFPAYVRARIGNPGPEAFRPASVSALLNQTLLREELGFNGLIVSDASDTGGLSAWGDRLSNKPEIIASGCDVILFSDHPADDMTAVRNAVADGRISMDRLEEAVLRMLALKARLGLFETSDVLPDEEAARKTLARSEHMAAAKAAVARAPTLVKDVAGIFPLSLEKTPRLLVIDGDSGHRQSRVRPKFILPGLLEKEGYDVMIQNGETSVSRDDFDLVLYLLGDEPAPRHNRAFIDWHKLSAGGPEKAMHRPWTTIPTAMISFGHPYHLYDAPRVPAYVNAYSATDSVQLAVLECMLGRAPFNTFNPVDPFCGMEDARH